jgi:hypothetical protein
MDALRRHPPLRAAVTAIVGVLVLTLAGCAVLWFFGRFSGLADQLAAEAVLLTLGTFVLGGVAGALALVAYAQSLRRPDLRVWFRIDVSRPSDPGEEKEPQRAIEAVRTVGGTLGGGWTEGWMLPPVWLDTTVSNCGDATAWNVVVVLT